MDIAKTVQQGAVKSQTHFTTYCLEHSLRAVTTPKQYFPDFKRNIKNPVLFLTTCLCGCTLSAHTNLTSAIY